MTAKHTEGPWKASETKIGGEHVCWGVLTKEGWVITGEVYSGPTYGVVRETAEANARLIAAAPDLLEALRWYVETDEVSNMEGNEFWIAGKARAIAAIAKATGENQ